MRNTASISLASVLSLAISCSSPSPTTPEEARAVLQRALAAHGGRERLALFDDFRLVSQVAYKGAAQLRRTVDYRGPQQWAMSIEPQRGGSLRMGISGDHCWKEDGYEVETCTADERRAFPAMAYEHNAWVLHQLAESEIRPAAAVRAGLRRLPAIAAGDMILVLDPDTHLLREIRHGERTDALSDFQEVAGAKIATHRVVTIAGEHDLEETWTEVLAGGSDPVALRPPVPPDDGTLVDRIEPARDVAWAEADDPTANLERWINRLDQAIRDRGRHPSGSDGVIWVMPDETSPLGQRWRIAVGIEVGAPVVPERHGDVHLDSWPETRILGVFHRGSLDAIAAKRAMLEAQLSDRGLALAGDGRLRIRQSRRALTQPEEQRLSFLWLPVSAQPATHE